MTRWSGGTLRMALVGLAAVVVLALAGCSSDGSSSSVPDGAATQGTTAVTSGRAPQGFVSVTLVVTAPDGTTREWCVWLADTPSLRDRGLMGVTDRELGGAAAMVFAFPADTAVGFWMKNTELPLSIAWFGSDGAYVSSADMDPCPSDVEQCPVTSAGARYRYAVEVAQGGLEPLGMVAGSRLSLGAACSPETAAA